MTESSAAPSGIPDSAPGNAGETHQTAVPGGKVLTTKQGVAIADNQNTLRVGPRGPALLEDFILREKIFHFDHERIPERVVHARGFGAHGFFESNGALESLSRAAVFAAGEITPTFVASQPWLGIRDRLIWCVTCVVCDQVLHAGGKLGSGGNNMPVFFIQDPMKFPDMVHAFKDEPDRGFPQAATAHDNAWDFITLTPESMHMIMWAMSDRAVPRSLRFMEGFGVHTFRLIDQAGNSKFVKFHWKPKLGMQSVTWNEAVTINGADPDYHRRDLWNAIEMGDFPEWELGVQVFDDAFAESFPFDVLDPTKLIPEEDLPITIAGRLVLSRNVENFFAETEQVAFCTQHVVPGIDFSNDPLLQGRNFSYLDTQLKRLGSPNFNQIPINAPKCAVQNFQQDGHMTMMHRAGRVNYEPNSWGEQAGPRELPSQGFVSFPEKLAEMKIRQRPESFADHYSQARQFYMSQTEVEQRHMADALIFELGKVQREDIRERMVSHLLNIDEGLANQVAEGLGMETIPEPMPAAKPTMQDLKPSPALSIINNGPDSFAGRCVGVLATDGASGELLTELHSALQAEKATMKLIAPKVGGIKLDDGSLRPADEAIGSAPSALFDAIVLLISEEAGLALTHHPQARDFLSSAMVHKKFVGYSNGAASLLERWESKAQRPMAFFCSTPPMTSRDSFMRAENCAAGNVSETT